MKKWFVRALILVQFVVIILLSLRLGDYATDEELRHNSVRVEEYPYGTFSDDWEEWKFFDENRRTAFIQDDGWVLWYDHGGLHQIRNLEDFYRMVDRGL